MQRYPAYFEVIKDPKDLKMIATSIQHEEYDSLQELEEDLGVLCKNAMTFNEPGSQIYRDAKALSKIVKQKRYELEVHRAARESRSSRSTRRLHSRKHYSCEIAELDYEDSESEESSEEDEEEGEEGDPLWQLYYHVKRFEAVSDTLQE